MAKKKSLLYTTADALMFGYGFKVTDQQKGIIREVYNSNHTQKLKEPVRLRAKALNNENVSLYLDIYLKGKRVYEFLKLYLIPEKDGEAKKANEITLKIANAIKAERIVSMQNQEHGFKSNTGRENINVLDYIDMLAAESLEKNNNKQSYYSSLNSLKRHLIIYAGNQVIFKQVDKDFIQGFVKYLQTAKNLNLIKSKNKSVEILSQNTQFNLFSKFGFVLKKAVKANIVNVNPFDKLDNDDKPKAKEGIREYLTIEEIKTLINSDCKNEIIKRAFLFCCLVGLRYSDVSTMTWGELQRDNNNDTIFRSKIKKTQKDEFFPISDEALKWLSARNGAGDDDLIFNLPENDNVNIQLRKWMKVAGINKKVTFHCSRHTAATLNLSLGVPIETVSKLLGHTNIKTTQIYAKIIDQSKKDAVNKQNGIFD